ncbi:hypothetical protein JXO59_12445 [candidate division KSB1 bacterium]|nr:hypothetical protein [candidate division KSB1 bacterium]
MNTLSKKTTGAIGNGYGSECHLLRWMGRHRSVFDKRLLDSIGFAPGASIEWLDFDFNPNNDWPDAELKGLEFLQGDEYRDLQKKWAEFWPLGGGIHNWDAVGWVHANGKKELLLVEAKAHTDEIMSDCGAANPKSIDKITNAFSQAKAGLHVPSEKDWTTKYYQFANRIATIYFLNQQGINARLMFIYFLGDKVQGKNCPKTKQEWQQALSEQDEWIGLPYEHAGHRV